VILDALELLMEGRTTLIVAHRLSTLRRADRVIVVNAGEVVEEGTHEALIAGGGLYSQLHSLQGGAPVSASTVRAPSAGRTGWTPPAPPSFARAHATGDSDG
jgi:ABC-type multidrug transport system ATPase subunit